MGSRTIFALTAALLASPTARAEDGNTRISIDYGVLAVTVDPGGPTGVAKHQLSLVLKPDRQIAEQYAGGGRYRRSSSRDLTLGGGDTTGVTYHVIDQNTIQRIQTTDTYTATMTIRVSGSSCSISIKYQLKPGSPYYVSFSQTLGRPTQYKSFSLVSQSCRIE